METAKDILKSMLECKTCNNMGVVDDGAILHIPITTTTKLNPSSLLPGSKILEVPNHTMYYNPIPIYDGQTPLPRQLRPCPDCGGHTLVPYNFITKTLPDLLDKLMVEEKRE